MFDSTYTYEMYYILKFFGDCVRNKDSHWYKLVAVSSREQSEYSKMLTLVKSELLKLHSVWNSFLICHPFCCEC